MSTSRASYVLNVASRPRCRIFWGISGSTLTPLPTTPLLTYRQFTHITHIQERYPVRDPPFHTLSGPPALTLLASYVGTLHEINSDESTVSLENVRSFGTEDRRGRPEDEVAPSDQVYEYIVFRGSDVKDLRIEEHPTVKENKPPPPMPDDPAIVGVSPAPFPSFLQIFTMMKYSGCKICHVGVRKTYHVEISVAFLLMPWICLFLCCCKQTFGRIELTRVTRLGPEAAPKINRLPHLPTSSIHTLPTTFTADPHLRDPGAEAAVQVLCPALEPGLACNTRHRHTGSPLVRAFHLEARARGAVILLRQARAFLPDMKSPTSDKPPHWLLRKAQRPGTLGPALIDLSRLRLLLRQAQKPRLRLPAHKPRLRVRQSSPSHQSRKLRLQRRS